MPYNSHDLIVTIVKKGWADKVVKASKQAGAEGATVIYGRGTGIHEQKKLLGLSIEPEKEMVLTIILKEETEKVLKAIEKGCSLDKPATGISFVIELKKVVGIVHLLEQLGVDE
ncbi:Putative regulatory protein, P-II family / Putative regulatory protein, P-II family [Candidatus Syntrophocurvum alkaliphilum]|uniref:Regulatory protein, P-II family / Putative regulatory protein, P-II family n=1 Tax=Candidatus Syntrophocurvum alkaliphilum TaxID=2293317 RepID=A0A6I6D607_9FIRM|nr:P-II family nitrogen regulator [Candidatus Syntrophocurvum alkaliphilum]QGT98733.1 Putative regulatory protein, P-II family / Putative regulatory protein, P-II family [Candidatus Syntrophocurvum alkaliphilum]